MAVWNPWHGCHKISAGCKNCYVYRRDGRYDKNSAIVTKNKDFDLPIRHDRSGLYKLRGSETVFACMTSDFFLEDADEWRGEIWDMIRCRYDLHFMIITKRIHRFMECIPDDWGDGWDNVSICCTVENQDRADFRLPIFVSLPIKRKYITCEPLLGRIDLTPWLNHDIVNVTVGGESGIEARECDFDWILDIRRQCYDAGVSFHFKQTGYRFRKDGKLYLIDRKFQHSQARKAMIDC